MLCAPAVFVPHLAREGHDELGLERGELLRIDVYVYVYVYIYDIYIYIYIKRERE